MRLNILYRMHHVTGTCLSCIRKQMLIQYDPFAQIYYISGYSSYITLKCYSSIIIAKLMKEFVFGTVSQSLIPDIIELINTI